MARVRAFGDCRILPVRVTRPGRPGVSWEDDLFVLRAPGQGVLALMPLPDAIKLDARMVTVGIAGPRSALALQPCREVLFHVGTHPRPGGDVEIGHVAGQVHEDHGYRVIDYRPMGVDLPRRAWQSPRADLHGLAIHCQAGLAARDLYGAASIEKRRRRSLETGEIVHLVSVQVAKFHDRILSSVVAPILRRPLSSQRAGLQPPGERTVPARGNRRKGADGIPWS